MVVAWNDLGMHCLNPTYDQAVILPPYNTLMAQVIRRGERPEVVTSGVTVEYRIVGNTYSNGKTDALGADFGGFWTNDQALFGIDLAVDTGLNLHDPNRHNGLTGTMQLDSDVFRADGIPLTPVKDDGTWTPYQVAEITVKSGQTVLITTQATVPTSDEINCAHCHGQNGVATANIGGGGPNPFANILATHDFAAGTHLVDQTPVLCASCHASPALGTPAPTDPAMYLSAAIHSSHADRGATCYDCHPGGQTSCNRSLAHTADDGHCVTCHGDLAQVGGSAASGQRIPWVQEPACATVPTPT